MKPTKKDLRLAEVEAIRKKHRGHLTPRIVLEEARSHPDRFPRTHGYFQWDDSKAAEAWRREQAHELISEFRVAYTKASGEPGSIRHYHAVTTPKGHEYRPYDEVLADPILRKVVLQDMERQVTELFERFENFKEFWQLIRRKKPPKAA